MQKPTRNPHIDAMTRFARAIVNDQSAAKAGVLAARSDARDRRIAQLSAMRDVEHAIYAVRTADDLIKIGYSQSLKRRLRAYGIEARNITDLLMVMPGSLQLELHLHHRFRPFRARGREYYRPALPIIEFINDVRCKAGVPLLAVRDGNGALVTPLKDAS